MKNIQMVDLVTQYEGIKDEVDQRMQAVLQSAAFINGPEVKNFQQELQDYLGVKHVIPCANGTDALQIALMGLYLEPGDEVITVDFTFAATVEVIGLMKLKPVLVDVYPDSYNMNIEQLKSSITSKTKAIVPVHLFGQCANMDAILEVAKEHNIPVVEDTAQSIGASYKDNQGNWHKAGTMGDYGTTSFFPSKNLGCYGDGGAVFTNDDQLAENARSMANHGMRKRYYYDEIGINSRLDSLQAVVLSVKLKRLDAYCDARRKVADYYDEAFKDIEQLQTPERSEFSTHVFHQYTMKTKDIDRDALQAHLAEQNIPAMIYYPVPLHTQKAYSAFGFNDADYPVTNDLCKRVISLPIHTELDEEQLNHIVSNVRGFISKLG